jgi:hypothetical protein
LPQQRYGLVGERGEVGAGAGSRHVERVLPIYGGLFFHRLLDALARDLRTRVGLQL